MGEPAKMGEKPWKVDVKHIFKLVNLLTCMTLRYFQYLSISFLIAKLYSIRSFFDVFHTKGQIS